jgi:hypothetical protein
MNINIRHHDTNHIDFDRKMIIYIHSHHSSLFHRGIHEDTHAKQAEMTEQDARNVTIKSRSNDKHKRTNE